MSKLSQQMDENFDEIHRGAVPVFMLRCVCGKCGREVFWLLSHTSWFLVQDERVKMPHRCHESWRS